METCKRRARWNERMEEIKMKLQMKNLTQYSVGKVFEIINEGNVKHLESFDMWKHDNDSLYQCDIESENKALINKIIKEVDEISK